jgi:type IV/VI secretion system ImpK/VasF family protein
MVRASIDVLAAAARIGEGGEPPAAALRETMVGRVHEFVARCRAAGLPDSETAEARYALVAFIDDRVLRSTWAGHAEWTNNPLQLQFFREYAAGEQFFARMRALVRRGKPAWALEIYCLCLAFGFTGAGTAAAARGLLDVARTALRRDAGTAPIAPNAVPTQRLRHAQPPSSFARAAAAACVAVCLVVAVVLHASLDRLIERTERELRAAAESYPTSGSIVSARREP